MSPASDPPFPPEASGAPSDGQNSAGMLPARRPRAALPAVPPPGGQASVPGAIGQGASADGYSYGPGTATWQPPCRRDGT